MDPEHKDHRDLGGPEDAASAPADARPVSPPPAPVDPAEDPLYIDPDDPLYIPVPLGEESDDVPAAEDRADEPPPDGGRPDGLTDPEADTQPHAIVEVAAVAPAPPPPPDAVPAVAPSDQSALERPEVQPENDASAASTVSADVAAEVPPTAVSSGAGAEHAAGRRHRRAYLIIAALLGVALLGIAGIAYAGYDYAKQYEGRILPGATVAGVEVGGMSPKDALAAVKKVVRPQLHRTIEVTWEDRSWSVTPKELGAHSNARVAVQAALAASSETSFLEKTKMRVLGDELTFANDVAISYPRTGARGFVQGLASNLSREARDAELDYSTGWVEITPSRRGREVNVARSLASLRGALVDGTSEAQLFVRTTEPEVTEAAFEKVILVRIGENKAYLYEDGKITHEYLVATGQPAYPTPTGVFEITEKRYMPTWINPAPDGWGSSMPASIPPGIDNPLGLRALNWSASGIRFHGTTAIYSLGYNASHGCVRMSNDDVIELYDLVDVGTPIVSLESADYRPLIEESSASTPTAENSAN
jgi:lipoprotein-anchoring transpeptidase ErfK/SrfK